MKVTSLTVSKALNVPLSMFDQITLELEQTFAFRHQINDKNENRIALSF
jgi:hypothetical protein